jgi:Tfp pilus tip-associated adhesin PilY1
VALIQRRGADPYYNLAIGSGYRGHPLHTETRDRFYSLRDKNPFGAMTQAQYDALTPLTDSGLVDISDNPLTTPVPTTAAGWKLELRLNGGWSGEKVLAEATTVGGTILFTTYQPEERADADPCQPTNGINRAYALRVDSGRPAFDFNDDEVVDARDLSTRLQQSGIAGEVSIALESVRAADTPAGRHRMASTHSVAAASAWSASRCSSAASCPARWCAPGGNARPTTAPRRDARRAPAASVPRVAAGGRHGAPASRWSSC